MVNRFPINYYLHLREQDVDHATAMDHVMQRYGVGREDLLAELRESYGHHTAISALLFESTLDGTET